MCCPLDPPDGFLDGEWKYLLVSHQPGQQNRRGGQGGLSRGEVGGRWPLWYIICGGDSDIRKVIYGYTHSDILIYRYTTTRVLSRLEISRYANEWVQDNKGEGRRLGGQNWGGGRGGQECCPGRRGEVWWPGWGGEAGERLSSCLAIHQGRTGVV